MIIGSSEVRTGCMASAVNFCTVRSRGAQGAVAQGTHPAVIGVLMIWEIY